MCFVLSYSLVICCQGYTALHIAAMSGRDPVIIQLIELYNANIHARDHSGKKPRDVVRETVAADVQSKLSHVFCFL